MELTKEQIKEFETITKLAKVYGDSDGFIDDDRFSNEEWNENHGYEYFRIDWDFKNKCFEVVEFDEQIKTEWIPMFADVLKQKTLKVILKGGIKDSGYLVWHEEEKDVNKNKM